MNDEAIAKFGQSLRGALIDRSHPEYEEARKLSNAMIDKRPLLVARCADAADVIAAVNFGRDNRLPIAIRAGGHSAPGLASVDDGLVIDLSMIIQGGYDEVQKVRNDLVDKWRAFSTVDFRTNRVGPNAFPRKLPSRYKSSVGFARRALTR